MRLWPKGRRGAVPHRALPATATEESRRHPTRECRARKIDDAQVVVTDEGRELHSRIHAAVSEITDRLWGDLPEEDLTRAAHVLGTVLVRANDELRGG
jgi:hypothetical protein